MGYDYRTAVASNPVGVGRPAVADRLRHPRDGAGLQGPRPGLEADPRRAVLRPGVVDEQRRLPRHEHQRHQVRRLDHGRLHARRSTTSRSTAGTTTRPRVWRGPPTGARTAPRPTGASRRGASSTSTMPQALRAKYDLDQQQQPARRRHLGAGLRRDAHRAVEGDRRQVRAGHEATGGRYPEPGRCSAEPRVHGGLDGQGRHRNRLVRRPGVCWRRRAGAPGWRARRRRPRPTRLSRAAGTHSGSEPATRKATRAPGTYRARWVSSPKLTSGGFGLVRIDGLSLRSSAFDQRAQAWRGERERRGEDHRRTDIGRRLHLVQGERPIREWGVVGSAHKGVWVAARSGSTTWVGAQARAAHDDRQTGHLEPRLRGAGAGRRSARARRRSRSARSPRTGTARRTPCGSAGRTGAHSTCSNCGSSTGTDRSAGVIPLSGCPPGCRRTGLRLGWARSTGNGCPTASTSLRSWGRSAMRRSSIRRPSCAGRGSSTTHGVRIDTGNPTVYLGREPGDVLAERRRPRRHDHAALVVGRALDRRLPGSSAARPSCVVDRDRQEFGHDHLDRQERRRNARQLMAPTPSGSTAAIAPATRSCATSP